MFGRFATSLRQPFSGALALSLFVFLLSCAEDTGTGPQAEVSTIEVTPSTGNLTALGETIQLTATARDASGGVIAGVGVTWRSSAVAVASIDRSSGLVTAVAVGDAIITATAGGVEGTADLGVSQEAASLVLAPDTVRFSWLGGRATLQATVLDANEHPIPGPTELDWTSSDATVASVDAGGVVTSKGMGSAAVTATLRADASVFGSGEVVVQSAEAGLGGLVYRVWFGRSDIAPAILANGKLTTPPVDAYDAIVNPTTPWGAANPDVSKFQWRGDRIGILTDGVGEVGTLRVRDRTGPWEPLVIGDAVDFQLEGDLIGVMRTGGRFDVKPGVHGRWRDLVSSGAVAFQLEGERIGVIEEGGLFRVKDGIDGTWEVLAEAGVRDFELNGNTLGVLFDDGRFWYKDNGIFDDWSKLVSAGAESFAIQGVHIVVLFDDGRLDGRAGVGGSWLPLEPGDVQDFQLEGNLIATLRNDGRVRIKNGVANPWTVLVAGGAESFQLQEDRIGYVSGSGQLFIKRGIDGPMWIPAGVAHGAGVIEQYRLIVDVPVPPVRIRADEYQQRQADCRNDVGGPECITPMVTVGVLSDRRPSLYGRFCGGGRPTDDDFAAADLLRGIDPLDEVCRHHDHLADVAGGSWYPEISNAEGACIVHYGLFHSQLTLDGNVITRGVDWADDPDRWNDPHWGQMPNLKDAVDDYFDTVTGAPLFQCNDLDAFSATQAGTHN